MPLNMESLVHLLDQPERGVIDEEGEGEEDDAGDHHHPGESPQRQLASNQNSVQVSEEVDSHYLEGKSQQAIIHPKFGVSA